VVALVVLLVQLFYHELGGLILGRVVDVVALGHARHSQPLHLGWELVLVGQQQDELLVVAVATHLLLERFFLLLGIVHDES